MFDVMQPVGTESAVTYHSLR